MILVALSVVLVVFLAAVAFVLWLRA
jgi:hypothetical protein